MAKEQFNCRLSVEVKLLIKSEVVRLAAETGQKVTEADVVEMAMVRWCQVDGDAPEHRSEDFRNSVQPLPDVADRRAVAESAMRGAEAGSAPVPVVPKVNKGSESVAQRKAREAQEHAAALAESDTVARMVGRDDIDYDLENVPHRSVAAIAISGERLAPRIIPEGSAKPRTFKPLNRPHGSTEAKRRRE
jgi:hypothetical protein